ncbi:MAG: hypothetical protein ACFFDP_11395, partial [Promethearchaeota archaeon]
LNGRIWELEFNKDFTIKDFEPINSIIYNITVSDKFAEIASSLMYDLPFVDYISILVCNLNGLESIFNDWIKCVLEIEELIE